MENGAVGVIGVNVQQNTLGAFKPAIEFAIHQHQNIMENIVR